MEPLAPNGKITYYDFRILELHPLYYVPVHCSLEHEAFKWNTSLLEREQQVDNIKPHTLYKIKVRAINGAGLGLETQIFAQTEPYSN